MLPVALLAACSFDTAPLPAVGHAPRSGRPAVGRRVEQPPSPEAVGLGRVAAGSLRPQEPARDPGDAPVGVLVDAGAYDPEDAAPPQEIAPAAGDPGWGDCGPALVCWLNPVGREHCSVTDATKLCRVDDDCRGDELCAPEGRCAQRCSPGL